LTEAFKDMQNITSNDIEGAMYAFPNVKLSPKAIAKAAS